MRAFLGVVVTAFLLMMGVVLWVAQEASRDVELYRAELAQTDELRTELTALRASIRSCYLEALEKIFLNFSPAQYENIDRASDAQFQRTLNLGIQKYCLPEVHCGETAFVRELNQLRAEYEELHGAHEKALNRLPAVPTPANDPRRGSAQQMMHSVASLGLQAKVRERINHLIQHEQQDVLAIGDRLKTRTGAMKRQMMVLAIVLAVLISVLVYVFYRMFEQGVHPLSRALDEFGRGNLEAQVPEQGFHEFSLLARAFNHMTASMRDSRERVQQQQAMLVHSERMSALGEMAGSIAHEINSPLSAIKLSVDLLADIPEVKGATGKPVGRILGNIEKSIVHITKVVSGLRAASRDASRDPFIRIPVKTLIEDTVAITTDRFNRDRIRMDVQAGPEGLTVLCRPAELCQVLVNLLNNAHDAAIEAGGERWVQLKVTAPEQQVRIEVLDSGKGVPKEIRGQLFQPFFTTKADGHGTGLGLSISQKIMEAHRGRLYLDDASALTRFVAEIPKA